MEENGNHGLTVEQAVAHLAAISGRSDRPLRLVVPYESGQVLIGAKPAVAIESFTPGIDWDHGKVFANPVHRIRGPVLELEQEQQLVRRAVNAIGSIASTMRNDRICQAEKLRLVAEAVARFNSKEVSVPGELANDK